MNSRLLSSVARDRKLESQINDALEAEKRSSLRGVSVEVHVNGVVLEGIVASYHDRQLVLNDVMRVAGDVPIIDNIVVSRVSRIPVQRTPPTKVIRATCPSEIEQTPAR